MQYGGVYVYPFIRFLNPLHFIGLTVISTGFNIFLYKLGEVLNSTIWDERKVEIVKSEKLKN